jgi:tetratricopeptide (TPR) repeat protein
MDIDLTIQLAFTYLQIGDLTCAREIGEKILRDFPENAEALHLIGLINYQNKKYDLAIQCLTSSLKFNASNAIVYCNLGNILSETERLDEAVSCYQKAVDINPYLEDVYKNFGSRLEQKGSLNEVVETCPKNSKYKILISVPVFNRVKITTLSLAQTKRYKTTYCHLQVYNDHSTEYDNSYLSPYADEVIQLPNKMGIHKLRWYQLRQFLDTNYDFIYMTDNDVIHDSQYIKALEALYFLGGDKLPVCIFNSVHHTRPHSILYFGDEIMLMRTAPGVSMFLDKAMVETIISRFDSADKYSGADSGDWDFRVCELLNLPWITAQQSFLEHFGGEGMHNPDYERDRALQPTQYLEERRNPILQYLVDDIPLQIIF